MLSIGSGLIDEVKKIKVEFLVFGSLKIELNG